MRNQLASVQWNEAIPEIAREATYNAGLNAVLSELGGVLLFENDETFGKPVNAKDTSLPLVVSGKEFAFNDVHSLTLQKYKLMKEAGGGNPNPSPTQPFTPSNNNGGGSTEPKLHPSTAAALAKLNIPS
jgi:hypothetical protein